MSRMKVLLLKDVPELGEAGEIYAVAGGYARNYLMPRGFAVLATKGAAKQAEEIKQAGLRARARERANAEAQAQMISGKRLVFAANAGENDRLYGSVTAAEIAEKLGEVVGFDVDRRRIELEHAIRDLGIYELSHPHDAGRARQVPGCRRPRRRRLERSRGTPEPQSRRPSRSVTQRKRRGTRSGDESLAVAASVDPPDLVPLQLILPNLPRRILSLLDTIRYPDAAIGAARDIDAAAAVPPRSPATRSRWPTSYCGLERRQR